MANPSWNLLQNAPVGTVGSAGASWDGKREGPWVNPEIPSVWLPPTDITGMPLFRGWMQEDWSVYDDPQYEKGTSMPNIPQPGQQYKLNFLFNPNSINETWTIDTNTQLPLFQPDTNFAGLATQGVAYSFILVFDRTVQDVHTTPFGVLHDIRILQKIASVGQGGAGSPANALYNAPVKIVLSGLTPARVTDYMKGTGNNRTIPQLLRWGFKGFLNSMSIDYTRFNKSMIPTVATATLGVTQSVYMPAVAPSNPVVAPPPPTTRGNPKPKGNNPHPSGFKRPPGQGGGPS